MNSDGSISSSQDKSRWEQQTFEDDLIVTNTRPRRVIYVTADHQ